MDDRKIDIFGLLPLNDEAQWVLDQDANSRHRGRTREGDECLIFGPRLGSKVAGRLGTFGRHRNNDVMLPSHARPKPGVPGASGSRYQNYRNHHCFFFLAESGELILRDLSPRLVHIEVTDATPEEAALYALHGSPRQRVIPRTQRSVTIIIGTNTYFSLKWLDKFVDTSNRTQACLAARARSLAAPGMTLTPPGRSSGSREPRTLHSRELHSRYTPSVASKAGPIKSCHKYQELGTGGFGTVYKVVDLSSGELWAVKEIVSTNSTGLTGQINRLRISLVHEVETMAKLSHARIAHYETYQDSLIGGSFQIFYKLYEGNLLNLVGPSHRCAKPPPPPAPWMPRMVTQMATALAYLHENGVLHLDIKPDNIFFDHTMGDHQPNFYLGDFGLAMAEADMKKGHARHGVGTPFFMAPEIRFGLAEPCQASDIWSFAMTIGEALGFWCTMEEDVDAAGWAQKLRVLGAKFPYTEPPELSAHPNIAFYRRISAAVAWGVLPPMFSGLLLDHTNRYTALKCMHTPPEFFTDRLATPQPLKGWKGMDAPWLRNWPLGWPLEVPAIQPNNRTRIPPRPGLPPFLAQQHHQQHQGVDQIRQANAARPQPVPAREPQPKDNVPHRGGQPPPLQQGTAQLPHQVKHTGIPQPPQQRDQRQNEPAGPILFTIADVADTNLDLDETWKPLTPEAKSQVPKLEGTGIDPLGKRTQQSHPRQESPKPLLRQSSSIPRRQQPGGNSQTLLQPARYVPPQQRAKQQEKQQQHQGKQQQKQTQQGQTQQRQPQQGQPQQGQPQQGQPQQGQPQQGRPQQLQQKQQPRPPQEKQQPPPQGTQQTKPREKLPTAQKQQSSQKAPSEQQRQQQQPQRPQQQKQPSQQPQRPQQQDGDRESTSTVKAPVQVSHTRTPRNDGGHNRFGFRGNVTG